MTSVDGGDAVHHSLTAGDVVDRIRTRPTTADNIQMRSNACKYGDGLKNPALLDVWCSNILCHMMCIGLRRRRRTYPVDDVRTSSNAKFYRPFPKNMVDHVRTFF